MTKTAQAAAALAFLGVVTAIVLGQQSSHVDPDHHHSRVEWDGGQPTGLRCYTVQARASRQALQLFGGVTAHDGGEAAEYVLVTVAYVPSDAGGGPVLPAGMDPLNDTAIDAPCSTDGGSAQVEAWAQTPGSPLPCACQVDAGTCLQPDGGAAPFGLTLNPGTFTPGPGCFPKTCQVWSGDDGYPPECPIPPSAPVPAFDPSTHYPDGGRFLFGPDGGLL